MSRIPNSWNIRTQTNAAPPPPTDDGQRRRTFLSEPGEDLILGVGPIDHAVRFMKFAERTGVDRRDLLSSTLCVPAIPLVGLAGALADRSGERARRCSALNISTLWHPLLWLPPRLSGRHRVTPAGELESNDTWAVRVCLELTASGMYDMGSGTWLDVLSVVGIDIDDPGGANRVARWLAGGSDPVLDAFDVDELIRDPSDPDWGVNAARAMLPDLRRSSWALSAQSLLDVLNGLVEDAENGTVADTDTDAIRDVAATVAAFGAAWTADTGDADGPGVPPLPQAVGIKGNVEELSGELDKLSKQVPDFTGSLDDLLDGPIDDISELLVEMRDRFWPGMENMINNHFEPTGA